ncbi:MAG: restriction endonuclease subunit S [Dehalococcoidia bacterium]|nr:restriction endonuclease subunit S [Dehalococcoidia bacterium]
MSEGWPQVPLGEVLIKSSETTQIDPERTYSEVTVRMWGNGVVLRRRAIGAEIAAERRAVVRARQFILSRIDARNGAFGVVPESLDGAVVSNDFPSFRGAEGRLDIAYLGWLSKTESFVELCRKASEGTTNRVRLKEELFLRMPIPLPPIVEQRRIVARVEAIAAKVEEAQRLRRAAVEEARALTGSVLLELLDPDRMGWPVVPLGEVAEVRAGVTLGRRLVGDTVALPYLRVANVQDGFLDLTTVKSVAVLPSEVDKWRLEPGDILVTEGGDWDKLGRGTVWGGEIEGCIHQNHILRIRVPQSEFEPRFVSAALGSPIGKEYFRAASKQTTNLASINQRQLKAFPLPRPQIYEQRRILTALDLAIERAAALSMAQARAQRELDAVLPAVLHRAFRGEL